MKEFVLKKSLLEFIQINKEITHARDRQWAIDDEIDALRDEYRRLETTINSLKIRREQILCTIAGAIGHDYED